jgi:hypothetical protein
LSTPRYVVELSRGIYIRDASGASTVYALEAKRFSRKAAARQAIFRARQFRKYDNPVIIDLDASQH